MAAQFGTSRLLGNGPVRRAGEGRSGMAPPASASTPAPLSARCPAHVPSRRTAAARATASWTGANSSHVRVNGRRRITGSNTANCGAEIPATIQRPRHRSAARMRPGSYFRASRSHAVTRMSHGKSRGTGQFCTTVTPPRLPDARVALSSRVDRSQGSRQDHLGRPGSPLDEGRPPRVGGVRRRRAVVKSTAVADPSPDAAPSDPVVTRS